MSDDGPPAAGGPPANVAGGSGPAVGGNATVVDAGVQNGVEKKHTFSKAHFDAQIHDMDTPLTQVDSRKSSMDLEDYFVRCPTCLVTSRSISLGV